MKRNAFTMVELIVIVVAIAILAAVSVVGYGAWRQNVEKSAVTNDLQAAAAAMEDERNFGDSGYPIGLPSSFQTKGKVNIAYVGGNSGAYCLEGSYGDSDKYMHISNDGIVQEGVCPEATTMQ